MTDIFFYGSLRDPDLAEIVLGRPLAPGEMQRAVAEGYEARRLADEDYPVLVPAPGARAEGVVLTGLGERDLARLAFFEEAEYGLAPITVETATGAREVSHFRASGKARATDAPWDYEVWRARDRAVALEAGEELMDHYARLPAEEIDRIWPGIMNRARQRARARAETPRLGRIRSAFAPGDVETLARERAYASYVGVEELRIRHRRFDGGWSREIPRTAVLWGDAATVLPYDPASDRVLLIEQFRAAPAARGDPLPWCIEVVAGRIDTGERLEETVRREAREEAGLDLGPVREVARYYATPGIAGEQLVSFVAEADLAETGGLHGAPGEEEDIRAFALGFDEAMRAVADGAVNTGPALVSLLWLAANRDAVRARGLMAA